MGQSSNRLEAMESPLRSKSIGSNRGSDRIEQDAQSWSNPGVPQEIRASQSNRKCANGCVTCSHICLSVFTCIMKSMQSLNRDRKMGSVAGVLTTQGDAVPKRPRGQSEAIKQKQIMQQVIRHIERRYNGEMDQHAVATMTARWNARSSSSSPPPPSPELSAVGASWDRFPDGSKTAVSHNVFLYVFANIIQRLNRHVKVSTDVQYRETKS